MVVPLHFLSQRQSRQENNADAGKRNSREPPPKRELSKRMSGQIKWSLQANAPAPICARARKLITFDAAITRSLDPLYRTLLFDMSAASRMSLSFFFMAPSAKIFQTYTQRDDGSCSAGLCRFASRRKLICRTSF